MDPEEEVNWGIFEAFWHERIGVVLLARHTDGHQFYWRCASDGDPAYLETVAEHLQARWPVNPPALSRN